MKPANTLKHRKGLQKSRVQSSAEELENVSKIDKIDAEFDPKIINNSIQKSSQHPMRKKNRKNDLRYDLRISGQKHEIISQVNMCT